MSKEKKCLVFSDVTKRVYFIPSMGQTVDVTTDFHNIYKYAHLKYRLMDFMNSRYTCTQMGDQEKENIVDEYIKSLP
jgi:hypothetical protein